MEADDLKAEAAQVTQALDDALDAIDADLSALPGPPASVDELAQRVAEGVSHARTLLRELQAVVEEAIEAELLEILCAEVSARKRRLETLRDRVQTTFAEANRRARASLVRREREELLGASGSAGDCPPGGAGAENEEEVADRVTASLQRTRQALARQLDHTESTLGLMDTSHATLKKVDGEYDQQTDRLSAGRRLLNAIEKQESLERLLLYVAVAAFFLVALFVVQKRTHVGAIFRVGLPALKSRVQDPAAHASLETEPLIRGNGVEVGGTHETTHDDGAPVPGASEDEASDPGPSDGSGAADACPGVDGIAAALQNTRHFCRGFEGSTCEELAGYTYQANQEACLEHVKNLDAWLAWSNDAVNGGIHEGCVGQAVTAFIQQEESTKLASMLSLAVACPVAAGDAEPQQEAHEDENGGPQKDEL